MKFKTTSPILCSLLLVLSIPVKSPADHVRGTPGDDTIFGSVLEDTLAGNDGDDVIYALEGDDKVMGGSGNDVLFPGSGSDRVSAGTGDDTVYYDVGEALAAGDVDIYNGNRGIDALVFDLSGMTHAELYAAAISVFFYETYGDTKRPVDFRDLQTHTADPDVENLNLVAKGFESVEFRGVNRAPVATDDTFNTVADTVLVDNVCANDFDPDGDVFVVSGFDAMSSYGAAVTILADGSLSYDPAGAPSLQALSGGQSVVDTFTYEISDDHIATDTAIVYVTVYGVD